MDSNDMEEKIKSLSHPKHILRFMKGCWDKVK